MWSLVVNNGAIDKYLTFQPQITYFKNVYRKHTAFAKEDSLLYDGYIDTNTKKFTLERDSDLLNGISLMIELKKTVKYKDDIEKNIIDSATIFFGDRKIQKITKDYINITNELLYKKRNTRRNNEKIFINLPFWFECVENALPLVSLKEKVTLEIKFNCLEYIENVKILKNKIFLDSEERRLFAQKKNSYIFTDIFYHEQEITPHKNDNFFSYRVDKIDNVIDVFIAFDNQTIKNSNKYINYENVVKNITITLENNVVDFDDFYYTNYTQITKYENTCDNVYVYSFSYKPKEAHKMSFGFNNSQLKFDFKFGDTIDTYKMKIMIRHYNFLSIERGKFELEKNNFYDHFEFPDSIAI